MNMILNYQTKLLEQCNEQYTLLQKQFKNRKVTNTILQIMKQLNDQIIQLTNEFEELNELFSHNQDITHKLQQYQQINQKIKELLPYIICETI